MIIQSLSDKDYQTLILDERRREFFAEGMRWQDIKRTNRLELLETLNGRTHLMYYPIPQAEIDMAGTDTYPQIPDMPELKKTNNTTLNDYDIYDNYQKYETGTSVYAYNQPIIICSMQ